MWVCTRRRPTAGSPRQWPPDVQLPRLAATAAAAAAAAAHILG